MHGAAQSEILLEALQEVVTAKKGAGSTQRLFFEYQAFARLRLDACGTLP